MTGDGTGRAQEMEKLYAAQPKGKESADKDG